MIWFPFKKKKQELKISIETIQRLELESRNQGIPQVLVLDLSWNQNGVGNVLVSFASKETSDSGYLRWKNERVREILSLGELRFELGKFYFYPNIDLNWKSTPRMGIHKLTSNYQFSSEEVYLEAADFFRLRSILQLCFQREGVRSLYFKGKTCQLEIPDLTKKKEERISEDILTYLSSLYQSPWEE